MLQKKIGHIAQMKDHIAQIMWQLQKNKNGDRP
jgi:hypothetical protein